MWASPTWPVGRHPTGSTAPASCRTCTRSSGSYYSVGVQVARADAQPGDIIVSPGHVGIYAGENMQIDAPRPGKTVQFRAIWQTNPTFVRVTG